MVVEVLLIAGDHVPVMLLLDVVGKLIELPEQIGLIWVKVGAVEGFTVTVMVAVLAH